MMDTRMAVAMFGAMAPLTAGRSSKDDADFFLDMDHRFDGGGGF